MDADTGYVTGVLPGRAGVRVGLVLLVAPLTSSVLAAAPDRYAGIASGINNAVARTGVAARGERPAGTWSGSAARTTSRPGGVRRRLRSSAQLICAVLLFAGGAVGFVGLREPRSGARSLRWHVTRIALDRYRTPVVL